MMDDDAPRLKVIENALEALDRQLSSLQGTLQGATAVVKGMLSMTGDHPALRAGVERELERILATQLPLPVNQLVMDDFQEAVEEFRRALDEGAVGSAGPDENL